MPFTSILMVLVLNLCLGYLSHRFDRTGYVHRDNDSLRVIMLALQTLFINLTEDYCPALPVSGVGAGREPRGYRSVEDLIQLSSPAPACPN
ncbi:hypothetical protein RRG08_056257 [Elysia crispata]|uniref:Uncharacterized protein n=1 Tax=Elysia crispata TaxID=231223 RepID=A0AAE1E5J4_9GAST|nr:hypothetical protein RRG08_056257 [Elysia crispata]